MRPRVSGSDDDVYAIGEVAELLGVPAPTIRSWERRHDLPVGQRTPAGHRRYRASDLAALQRMRDELAAGRTVADAAGIAASTLTASPPALVEELCAAARHLDPSAITAVLDHARTVHGLAPALELVLLPAMRELGREWAEGTGDVAHEHLATSTAQRWLRIATAAAPPVPAQDPVVLACAPDEQHTLALDALAELLRHAGVHHLHLGARVPADSLAKAVLATRARAVVVSCQLDRNRASARTALRAAADTPAAVYYAGAAFRSQAARRHLPGRYLGDALSGAVEQLRAS